MLTKPLMIGLLGGTVAVGAITLNYVEFGDEETQDKVVSEVGETKTPAPKAETPKAEAAKPATTAKSPAIPEKVSEPSFDVVRVDPEGNTVIAGRATPNSEVTILDDGVEIGKVQSDARGEWVFIPETKLPPGSRALALKSVAPNGDTKQSSNAVVIVIPEAGKDLAGKPTQEPVKPLAMVVPKGSEEMTASIVLQAPKPPSKEEEAQIAAAAQANADSTGNAGQKTAEAASEDAAKAATEEATQKIAQNMAAASKAVKTFPETKPNIEAAPGVAVDVIDYDDKGQVIFSGSGEPGKQIQVYLNNKLVGRAAVDEDGKWELRPDGQVKVGTHTLRVDQVEGEGKVLARVALPFMRAQPITDLPEGTVVVIQPGNNLWRIATKVYGSGLRFTEIYNANRDQIGDPDLIFPGQVFGLPKLN